MDFKNNKKRMSVDFHTVLKSSKTIAGNTKNAGKFIFSKKDNNLNSVSQAKLLHTSKSLFQHINIFGSRLKKRFYKSFFWGRGVYYKYSILALIIAVSLPVGVLASSIKQDPSRVLQTQTQGVSDAAIDTGGKTIVPSDKTVYSILTYVVQKGDSLYSIASKFNISKETIQYANKLDESSILQVGSSLKILPYSGILYTVKKGDTLKDIASKYNIAQSGYSDQVLLDVNVLDSTDLVEGQQLLVPGAVIDLPKPTQAIIAAVPRTTSRIIVSGANSQFIPPTAGIGHISTCFSAAHPAVDIDSNALPPIIASASGKVMWAGYGLSGGSGIAVRIDHGNGFVTEYLHMSRLSVSVGDVVVQGQQLGIMGATGRATGPHVHFIIKYNGINQNPFNYVDLSGYPREYTATTC